MKYQLAHCALQQLAGRALPLLAQAADPRAISVNTAAKLNCIPGNQKPSMQLMKLYYWLGYW